MLELQVIHVFAMDRKDADRIVKKANKGWIPISYKASLEKTEDGWNCNDCKINSGKVDEKIVPFIPVKEDYECGFKQNCPYQYAIKVGYVEEKKELFD